MMGYFLIYRCAVERKRVVVVKAGWRGEKAHLFCEDGVFKLDDEAFQRELCRQDVLCAKTTVLKEFTSYLLFFLFCRSAVIYWTG